MRNLLCSLLIVLLLTSIVSAAPKDYSVTVTPQERSALHSRIDADKDLLIETMLTGSTFDSISYGGALAGTVYPFPVNNTAANRNEGIRKITKLRWAYDWAKNLGIPRVVQYQPYNFVYAEIGDPDAPEMVMSFSHLDSPSASINANNSARWVDSTGARNPNAYRMPYVKDGWIYGCGIQDDGGPTLASLITLKAVMDANLTFDRRIRVVLGGYEDSSPTRPTVLQTLDYVSIPFPYTSTTFYDGWAYKYLNREEIPVAGFTVDSRFPMNLGTRREIGSPFAFDLSDDAAKPFRLAEADMHVTTRPNEPTIIDIIGASGTHIPSQGRIMLELAGASANVVTSFKNAVQAEITAKDWAQKVTVAEIGTTYRLTANSWKPVDAVTPQYGSNGLVMAMHLANKGFDAIRTAYPDIDNLAFRKMAKSVADLFMPNGVQDYLGTGLGLYERDEFSRVPLLSISFGQLNTGASNITTHAKWYSPQPLYPVNVNASDGRPILTPVDFSNYMAGKFLIRIYAGTMCQTEAIYNDTYQKMVKAFTDKGWTLLTNTQVGAASFTYLDSGAVSVAAPTYGNGPPMHLAGDNIAIKLLLESYRNSARAPMGMEEPFELLDISAPTGSTGGNYSSDYWNKMIIFGAIIPGNERWFHTANERMTVKSAIQTGKFLADALVELGRYMGPAGAQVMWADIPGYNADRADRDLLDMVLDTFVDASDAVPASALDGYALAAATKFDIPMFRIRWNTSATSLQIARGHHTDGIYLPADNLEYLANDYVLPMRLEFKLTKESLKMDNAKWQTLKNESVTQLLPYIKFGIMRNGTHVPLTLPSGMQAEKFFYKRVSDRDPNSLYVSINIALVDGNKEISPTAIMAKSTPDLYKLNPAYKTSFDVPVEMKGRGQVDDRGFFLFGDGDKDAHFICPPIYVAINQNAVPPSSTQPAKPAEKPYNNLDLPKDGVTLKAIQDATTGNIKVTITLDQKLDIERLRGADGWLTFFFYGNDKNGGSANPINWDARIQKKVTERGNSGIFDVEFNYDDLKYRLKHGTTYAIHYSDERGNVIGYSTFDDGGFTFTEKESGGGNGCNAGIAGTSAFAAAVLWLIRRRMIRK